MKQLFCVCGHTVFCDSTWCVSCGRTLAFDAQVPAIVSLDGLDDKLTSQDGRQYRLCGNRLNYGVCNGIVPADDPRGADALCGTCSLNRTIPVVGRAQNLLRWKKLERAKSRLIAGLATLGLEVTLPNNGPGSTLRFDFMEDKRSHPDVLEAFVSTGHKDGVITVNVLEADDIQRIKQQELMGERYRTVLGHLRHEAGHFYYPLLAEGNAAFRELFGDPTRDYGQALQAYYDAGPAQDWEQRYISAYASSHPLEDWAECFAHYLHMQDTLETANAQGMCSAVMVGGALDEQLTIWSELTIHLNELNRSLGLRDAYPFIINARVADKLRLVQQSIADLRGAAII